MPAGSSFQARQKDRGSHYLVTEYVPAICLLLHHYAPGSDAAEGANAYLTVLREDAGSPIRLLDSTTGREFLVGLRDHLAAWAGVAGSDEARVDFEVFADVLREFTVVERQMVWFNILGYSAEAAAATMRVSPDTGRAVTAKATALLAEKGMSAREQSAALQAAARSLDRDGEVPLTSYLHLIDG